MKTVTGYLSAVRNPNFSGIATVTIRTSLRPRKTTRYVTAHVDAGYGVRRLADAFAQGGRFVRASGEVRARWYIDDLGMIHSVEVL